MRKKRIVKGIIGVCVFIIMIMFGISGVIYYSVLNKHVYTFENSRGLPEFSAYEGLEREEACFYSNQGNKLQGYFYSYKDNKKNKGVIIVNNGFGSGHEGMLSEIMALVQEGYLVYGFDKTGYDSSEGKGVGSLSQGIQDLYCAIEYVSASQQAENLDIILYGKSWGAYCSLAVLGETDKVEAVVSMSAFNKTSDMMRGEAKRMLGSLGEVLTPFVCVFDWMNEEHKTAVNGIENSDAKILIMHSIDDEIVSVEQSYRLFEEIGVDRGHMDFVLFDNKNHSILKSEESALYMQQMECDLQEFAETNGGEMTEELWDEFLGRYDLRKGVEPDAEVLEIIFDFIQ